MTDRDAVNVRLTREDRAALAMIRKRMPWLRTDSDAVRYALDVAREQLGGKRPRAGPKRR